MGNPLHEENHNENSKRQGSNLARHTPVLLTCLIASYQVFTCNRPLRRDNSLPLSTVTDALFDAYAEVY